MKKAKKQLIGESTLALAGAIDELDESIELGNRDFLKAAHDKLIREIDIFKQCLNEMNPDSLVERKWADEGKLFLKDCLPKIEKAAEHLSFF
ncbi:MAG: hypothetical protein KDD61_00595 [Bdellovibrionales bacterium]|nr:hypothetical protein [Bdellovibrionales bacterium]